MPTVHFSHKVVNEAHKGPLAVHTGMDSISWSYNLNTAHWPTYGGEVVQILSVYIEDMTIQGMCRSYVEMERIYSWFATYMQIATQGNSSGGPRYNQEPVVMTYGARNWTFEIQPKAMPGFKYGRDVVIPTWSMMAHVVDTTGDYKELQDLTVSKVLHGENGQNFAIKGQISPNEGDPTQNPFQSPGTVKGNKFTPVTASQSADAVTQEASYFSKLIDSYQNGDFTSLGGTNTGPAFGSTSAQKTQAGAKPGKGGASGGSGGGVSSGSAPSGGIVVTASTYAEADNSPPGTQTSSGTPADSNNGFTFAELKNGTALGGLPYNTQLNVNLKGKNIVVICLDHGGGGPGLNGHVRAIDLWHTAADALGLSGLDDVTISRVDGKPLQAY